MYQIANHYAMGQKYKISPTVLPFGEFATGSELWELVEPLCSRPPIQKVESVFKKSKNFQTNGEHHNQKD